MTTKSPSSVLRQDGRTITVDKANKTLVITDDIGGKRTEVIVPDKFSPYLAQVAKAFERFGESASEAAKAMTKVKLVPTETQDAIKMLREMLRQAERGEVVLCSMTIKNQQKDRWEGGGAGPERLRMDNRFKVELEMYARDPRAMTQPPPQAVRVDVDDAAAEVLSTPAVEYVTLEGNNATPKWYRLPLQPIRTLPDRILQRVSDSGLEYNTLRISYQARDRLVLEGLLTYDSLSASPVNFLGLDLMIEAPDGRAAPNFADDPTEYFDEKMDSVTGNAVSRRTLNESITQNNYVTGRDNVTRGVTTTRRTEQPPRPPKPPKPMTPAGASAAREIIFDD